MWRVGPIYILFLAAVWAIFVHFSQNKSKSTNTLSQDKNKSRTEDFPWWAGASGCYDKIRVLSGKLASVFELFDILKICSNFWLKWRQPFNLILWPGSREYHIYQVYQLFPCIPKEWQISTIIPTVTNGYKDMNDIISRLKNHEMEGGGSSHNVALGTTVNHGISRDIFAEI